MSIRVRNRLVVLLMITVVAAVGTAQIPRTLTSETDIQAFEDAFLASFLDGDFNAAFELFRGSASALSRTEIDSLEESTSSQLATIRDVYGRPIDAKFARRSEVAGMLLRREYLLRYEFLPLRAEFIYYSEGTSWRLTYFGWDDDFASLFSP